MSDSPPIARDSGEGPLAGRPSGRPPRMSADGTLTIRRVGLRRLWHRDLYHFLRTATWPRLLLFLVTVWLCANAVFALLYLAGGPCIANAEPGSFSDAFFFSVQTLSTIGYGGLAPATLYADIVASIEAFCGLLIAAMTAGLFFAKFATPSARVLFTRSALITNAQGKRVLMIRMANERASQIVDATLRMTLAYDDVDERGSMLRRLFDLTLVRDRSPFFALTWTAMHVIDEASPLYGKPQPSLTASNAMLMVTLSGVEDALAQQVHARYAYTGDTIVFDHRYADVLRVDEHGDRYVDYRFFHDHEPN